MSITNAAQTAILNSAVAAFVGAVAKIVLYDAGGEVLRKEPTQTNVISPTKTERVFYITEEEAKVVVTRMALIDAAGTELCTTDCNIDKASEPHSLQVRWTTEVV